jgi:hypothetical protein
MSKDVIFTCTCGVKTKQPFSVGWSMMCAVCAEKLAPGLVYAKVSEWNREEWEHHRKVDRPRRMKLGIIDG